MKKNIIVWFLCLLALSFLINGCGGKYSDAIEMNEEYIGLIEDYLAALDKVENAKDAAKAMNRFADGMEDIWPKMKEISKKYPELKDKDNQPEELKESQKKAGELGNKIAGSFMKLMPYMQAPEVQRAQKRISAVMTQK